MGKSVQALSSLSQGDYVGDVQLLFGRPNDFTLTADVFSEVMVLTRESLLQAVEGFCGMKVEPVADGLSAKWFISCLHLPVAAESSFRQHENRMTRILKVRDAMEESVLKKKLKDMIAVNVKLGLHFLCVWFLLYNICFALCGVYIKQLQVRI